MFYYIFGGCYYRAFHSSRAHCPSNCIFPPATLLSKMKTSKWK